MTQFSLKYLTHHYDLIERIILNFLCSRIMSQYFNCHNVTLNLGQHYNRFIITIKLIIIIIITITLIIIIIIQIIYPKGKWKVATYFYIASYTFGQKVYDAIEQQSLNDEK